MNTTALYDLTEAHALPHGTAFRSRQLAKCRTCGAVTNALTVKHRHLFYHQTAIEFIAICPNATETWHEHLRQKIAMRNPFHPRIYRTALEKEIKNLLGKAKPNNMRDVVGVTDVKPTLETYETDPIELSLSGFDGNGRNMTKVILSPKTTITTTRRRTS